MITFTGIKFQFEISACLFIHDLRSPWRGAPLGDTSLVSDDVSLASDWSMLTRSSLTSSKGGLSPMGKLIVFKLTSSMVDDILVKGPKVLPSSSLNTMLLMWCSSSSGTRIPNTVSSPSIRSTTNSLCKYQDYHEFRFRDVQQILYYSCPASLYPLREKRASTKFNFMTIILIRAR